MRYNSNEWIYLHSREQSISKWPLSPYRKIITALSIDDSSINPNSIFGLLTMWPKNLIMRLIQKDFCENALKKMKMGLYFFIEKELLHLLTVVVDSNTGFVDCGKAHAQSITGKRRVFKERKKKISTLFMFLFEQSTHTSEGDTGWISLKVYGAPTTHDL